MDLDELQSVQSRERQTDSLQQLRESFYTEASEYVQHLREQRSEAAERADDPWDNPEVNHLSDEINTAEQTVEAIYDRRTGKIVKKASLAAADIPTDDEGLTAEEQALFETLVEQIENNRNHVLDMIEGAVSPDSTPVPSETTSTPDQSSPDSMASESSSSDVSAADVMGAGEEDTADPDQTPPPEAHDPRISEDEADSSPTTPPEQAAGELDEAEPSAQSSTEPSAETSTTATPSERSQTPSDPAVADGTPSSPASTASQSEADSAPTPPPETPPENSGPPSGGSGSESSTEDTTQTVDRSTVRITQDVGEILGVDQRAYDLSTDDVVTLPEANVGPLLENNAAERFD